MSKLANVWVFSDNVERYAELMTGARQWGEHVHLIVQGSEQANQVKPLGADEIIVLEAPSGLQRVELRRNHRGADARTRRNAVDVSHKAREITWGTVKHPTQCRDGERRNIGDS